MDKHNPYPHLHDSARNAIDLPTEERVWKIRSQRWIGYTRATEILAKLEDLLLYPPSTRPANILIVGDSNNGKTSIINRFASRHPPTEAPNNEGVHYPVLLIHAPEIPEEKRFYQEILNKLFAVYKPNDTPSQIKDQAHKLLEFIGVKILIIDEIHHILAGTMLKQKQFLNVIKTLGNRLQISVVGAGTKDAFRAIHTDTQLANRFLPEVLPRWKYDSDFIRLLVSFESLIPLKEASNLRDENISKKIFAMSEGLVGEILTLLTTCAVHALRNGQERIDLDTLNAVGWTNPSDRSRKIDLMGV